MVRLMIVRAASVVLLLPFALVGCSAASADREPSVQARATSPTTQDDAVGRAAFLPGPGPGYEALATGMLHGDPASGCLWLEQATLDEPGVRQVPLRVFDDDAYVDFGASPAEVRTRHGRLLHRLGDDVSLGGGYIPAADYLVDGCPVGGDTVFLSSRFTR
jgi:hypothetical protein